MEFLDLPREALIAQIEAAFLDPGYPAERRPCSHLCDECDELGEIFCGKRWHEIANLPMHSFSPAMFLLSDDAFLYFLPGLMVGCLRNPEAADFTFDYLVWDVLGSTRLGVIEMLCAPQRSALYAYLYWSITLYGHDPAEEVRLRELETRYPPNGTHGPYPLPFPA